MTNTEAVHRILGGTANLIELSELLRVGGCLLDLPQYFLLFSLQTTHAKRNNNPSPSIQQVICGRGKAARDHEGNISFRSYIETEIDRYKEATTKLEKTIIVSHIVQNVRNNSPKGGFVKLEDGRWFEVGDHLGT